DIGERLVEGLGRQVFGVLFVAGAEVDVTVDAVDVAFVQNTEGARVAFGALDQLRVRFGRSQLRRSAFSFRAIEHRAGARVARPPLRHRTPPAIAGWARE